MKITHRITYYLLVLLKKWISTLSPKTRYHLAIRLASISYHYIPKRKGMVINNLKRAFPDWTSGKIEYFVKRIFQFFMHNMIQFFAFPKSWDGIEIDVKRENILHEAMNKNKGCILISAHFGVWELFVKWMGETNYRFTGVALRQKNRGANKFFQEQREMSGVEHIFRKEPIEKMESVLIGNGILALVSDQDARSKGIFVNFFGIPASTPKGAALFFKKLRSPIIFGVCVEIGFQKYEIQFETVKPISDNIADITQAFTSIIEEKVRKYPEQYFWFHRRWKTKPN